MVYVISRTISTFRRHQLEACRPFVWWFRRCTAGWRRRPDAAGRSAPRPRCRRRAVERRPVGAETERAAGADAMPCSAGLSAANEFHTGAGPGVGASPGAGGGGGVSAGGDVSGGENGRCWPADGLGGGPTHHGQ